MALASLMIDVGANVARIQRDMGSINYQVQKASRQMKTAIRGVSTALTGMIGAMSVKKIVDVTTKQQNALNQLAAAVKSTGGAAGQTVPQLAKFAAEIQKVSTYGDEAVMEMQSVLLTFTKIGGDTFPRATKAVADLSARMGTDLKSAALQVGKVLNDPVANMGALTRAGIQFSVTQKETIKKLWEGGQAAEAQAVILKELETQFGGSAAAARDTLGGALTSLGNAFWDLFEVSKAGAAPLVSVINKLTENIGEVVRVGAALAALALPKLMLSLATATMRAAKAVKVLTIALASNPLGLIATAAAMAVSSLVLFHDKTVTIGNTTATVLDWVKAAWNETGGALIEWGKKVYGAMNASGKRFLSKVGDIARLVYKAYKIAFLTWLTIAKTTINTVIGLFVAVKGTVSLVAGAFVDVFSAAFTRVSALASTFWQGLKDVFTGDFSFSAFTEELSKGFETGLSKLAGKIGQTVKDAMTTDYMGGLVDSVIEGAAKLGENIGKTAKQYAAQREEAEKAGNASLEAGNNGARGAQNQNKALQKQNEELERARKAARNAWEAQRALLDGTKKSLEQAKQVGQELIQLEDAHEDFALAMAKATGDSLRVQELEHARFVQDWVKRGVARTEAEKLWALEAVKTTKSALTKLIDKWKDTGAVIDETFTSAMQNIHNAATKTIAGIIRGEDGFNSLSDIAKSTADLVVDIFSNAFAQILSRYAASGIGHLFDWLFGNSSGAGGNIVPIPGVGGGSGLGNMGSIAAGANTVAGWLGLGGGASATGGAAAGVGLGAGGVVALDMAGITSAAATGSAGLGVGASGAVSLDMAGIGAAGLGTAAMVAAPIAIGELFAASGLFGEDAVGPVGAVSQLLGFGGSQGFTKDEAREYIQADLEYLQRALEDISNQAAVMNGAVADAANQIDKLADTAGYSAEEMTVMVDALGPVQAAIVEGSIATSGMADQLQYLGERFQGAADSASDQAYMAKKLNSFLAELDETIRATTDGAVVLGDESQELATQLFQGSITAEVFADRMQSGLYSSLVNAADQGSITAEVMRDLNDAINSINLDALSTAGSWSPPANGSTADTYHVGGVIKKAHAGIYIPRSMGPREVPIIARAGEGVLTENAVARIGGEAAINALNGGKSIGGHSFTINVAVNGDIEDPKAKGRKLGEAAWNYIDQQLRAGRQLGPAPAVVL